MRGGCACALATLSLASCGGNARPAPSGSFRLDVTRASFPARQSVAQPAVLRLAVANPGARAVPTLAVTVRTDAAPGSAFGQASDEPGVADAGRPVWIVDRGPRGGDTAYTDTWAVGRLAAGATRTLRWRVTAVRPGRYTLRWRLAPALAGDATVTGRTSGAFRVTIDDSPVPARVDARGRVVRRAAD